MSKLAKVFLSLDLDYKLHICRDGTVTICGPGEPVFNGVALPFYSCKTRDRAQKLRVLLCAAAYVGHPKLPGETWYQFPGFKGEVDDIARVTSIFKDTEERHFE